MLDDASRTRDHQRSSRRRAASFFGAALCALVLSPARSALALDPFEIQVYDGSIDPARAFGLELHVNHVVTGAPTLPPRLPPDGQTHFTLEPSYGLLSFLELGAYLQTSLRPDGQFDFAGAKLRAKLVLPTPPTDWRLGVNVEVSRLPRTYEPQRWGTEVRPILAFENYRWWFAANPILDFTYTGPDANKGPSLDPAVMLKLKLEPLVAVGVEYYASLGPIGALAQLRDQEHYLFEAADLLLIDDFELNLGVGEGLTDASNTWVGKMIIGYVWE